jgi:hypothetical protein
VDRKAAGQEMFFFGDVAEMRHRLGLSLSALSLILGVAVNTLYRWEGWGLLARLSPRNAEMVYLFCEAGEHALEEYPDFRERFMTTARAAQRLGISNEYFMKLYREDKLPLDKVHDFGILGLFVERS